MYNYVLELFGIVLEFWFLNLVLNLFFLNWSIRSVYTSCATNVVRFKSAICFCFAIYFTCLITVFTLLSLLLLYYKSIFNYIFFLKSLGLIKGLLLFFGGRDGVILESTFYRLKVLKI